ncbi:MAG: hypothetical protein CMJ46_12215 [Planctomyces sp.]|nr:hypothetical protein [Planctomyces sp.]
MSRNFSSSNPNPARGGIRVTGFARLSLVILTLVAITSLAFAALAPFSSPSEPVATERKREARFAVEIHKPDSPPLVEIGLNDENGNPITATCATCHANREPDPSVRTVEDLKSFHRELVIDHGKLSCFSCHNSADYSSLKLADGTRVEFTEVMQLCAQCHGPQMKDYENGVHGGMVGHWDLSRGPQQKNNCVDCHRPHAPQFPRMIPTFKPDDRFLDKHVPPVPESAPDLIHE